MFLLDAHLDLAMNAIDWNRDLQLSVQTIREREYKKTDKPGRGNNTVSFDALRKAKIGICVATQIARYSKPNNPFPGWQSPHQAWAHTQAQLAWYKEMERQGELFQIKNAMQLQAHFNSWNSSEDVTNHPIGYILSLEGADSIVSMEHLHWAYNYGLRALGPAHYGPGTYAFGTDSEGGIGEKGRTLLKEISKLKMILDVTHLSDQSFWETMDCYSGPLWASHNNCRAIVHHNRQFSDEQIAEIISRGGIIGAVFDVWMMVPNWKKGISNPSTEKATLSRIVQHIDHICQIAGNTNHVGIGSDLDGGFGKEQSPSDLDTIADLQKLKDIFLQHGFSLEDVEKIFYRNFFEFLKDHL